MVLADFFHDTFKKTQISHAKYITQASFNDSSRKRVCFLDENWGQYLLENGKQEFSWGQNQS